MLHRISSKGSAESEKGVNLSEASSVCAIEWRNSGMAGNLEHDQNNN